MNYNQVKNQIQELFNENVKMHLDAYPLDENGLMTNEGAESAQDVAKMYYRERSEEEIKRDEALEITEVDYVDWVMEELENCIENA